MKEPAIRRHQESESDLDSADDDESSGSDMEIESQKRSDGLPSDDEYNQKVSDLQASRQESPQNWADKIARPTASAFLPQPVPVTRPELRDELTSSDPSPRSLPQNQLPASQETFCDLSPQQQEQPSLTANAFPSTNLQNSKPEPHHLMMQQS